MTDHARVCQACLVLADQADVCYTCKELESSHPSFLGERVPGLQLAFTDAQLIDCLVERIAFPRVHQAGSVLSMVIPDMNVYKSPPWLLPAKDCRGDHHYYYYSPSPSAKWKASSMRANDSDRSAGCGRWKNMGGKAVTVQSMKTGARAL
eukprot:SM000348S12864  [mRNA]  locus=s348:61643:62642:+ [translate_table: standard]